VSITVFTTFDGLVVNVRRFRDASSDESEGEGPFWFAIGAESVAPIVAAKAEADDGEADEVAIDDTTEDVPVEESAEADTVSLAAGINARHAGWQYRIPEYKANLIARRWADILKAQDE
jgi:hypothetical protein